MFGRGLGNLFGGRKMNEAVAAVDRGAAVHTGALGIAPFGCRADFVDRSHDLMPDIETGHQVRNSPLRARPWLVKLHPVDADCCAPNSFSGDDIRGPHKSAIHHLDAIDAPIGTFQIKRWRAFAGPQQTPDWNIVRFAIGVDDLEVQHLDVVFAGVQPDGSEAALSAPDFDDVTITAKKTDVPAPEFDPFRPFTRVVRRTWRPLIWGW